jgi:hypothetical protein
LTAELDDIQESLLHNTQELEEARTQVRGELRPAVQTDAIAILQDVLTQAERLLAAQQRLQELAQQGQRLGITMLVSACIDSGLGARIQAMRHTLARLSERTRHGAERGGE